MPFPSNYSRLTILLLIPLSQYFARIMEGHYKAPRLLAWFEGRLSSGPQDWKQYTVALVVFNMLFVLCGSKGVTLYQYYWCPFCAKVRTLFARYHVRYKIVEASDNPSVLMKKFGDTSVPWTVVDGVALAGYDEPRLRQLLCLK